MTITEAQSLPLLTKISLYKTPTLSRKETVQQLEFSEKRLAVTKGENVHFTVKRRESSSPLEAKISIQPGTGVHGVAYRDEVVERAKDHPEWVDVFERCYTDTLDNTVEILEDGSTFVLTEGIPAMWLRDSTAQLRPYLHVAKRDALLRQTIAGLVKRQMTLVLKDPYANSFNIEENWKGHHETDHTDLNGWIWERKYEVDSLCYPLQLAYLLWKETGETSQFDETFVAATKEILHLWTVEQDHNHSPYRFVRDTDRKEDTLVSDGFGLAFAVTGMTWSAFRPSDDCCQYSYLIPSNMFAVVVLGYAQEIFAELDLADSQNIMADAKRLQAEIQEGIENYAYTTNSKGEKIYAFEVEMLASWIIQTYQVCWLRLIWATAMSTMKCIKPHAVLF